MTLLSATAPKPWYREPWPWFLMSLPAAAVVAGISTVWIAATDADGLVVGDYYKAGLAINQTLARDDAARSLALHANVQARDGVLTLTLAGRLQAWPPQLDLVLAHPTRPGQDQHIVLSHVGAGAYRAALPHLPDGKWHAQLSDGASTWRLSGVLHTPFSASAVLAADTGSTVQSKGD